MGMLDGRVALVTGAGGGIGAAVARTLAAEGAKVVVNDIGTSLTGEGADKAAASEVVDGIVAAGGTAVTSFGDVGDFDQAREIIGTALDAYGRLDTLVNVAGIVRDRMIFNMEESDWDAVIRVHLKGTFNTTRHAAAWWRQHRGGDFRLLNFISGAGLFGAPGQPNYAAAKMGILGLTLSCSNALRRYGVASVAVSPGAATRMTAAVPSERAAQVGIREDDEMAPENMAAGVAYLAGPDSAWLNGQTVGLRGYKLILYTGVETSREVVGTGPWTPAAAGEAIERAFRPALERRSIFADQVV
jgi:NAD(P)-dependent dehydrogenase (short-subunit alcohol dehydrogenase family)